MKRERARPQMHHQTPLQDTIVLPKEHPRSDRFLRSVSYQGPQMWMELQPEIQWLDLINFNSRLRELIQDEMSMLISI